MLRSVSLLGLRFSGLTTLLALGGFCDPSGYLNTSETTSTAFAAAPVACAVAGAVAGASQTFQAVLSQQVSTFYQGRIMLRLPWTVTTPAAGGAARATLQAEILTGSATAPVVAVTVQGAPRDISQNGAKYVEIIACDLPAGVVFTPGQVIQVRITPFVTVGVAGNTYLPTLRHDPTNVGDQLVAEFQDATVIP